jgi:hypothetical protein
MTRSDLLNRVITAAALVALAVTLGVWMTRSPLTAAPAATPPTVAPLPSPVKSIRPAEALREPTLAPLPPPAVVTPSTVTTEVQVEVEIAPPLISPAPVVTDPPAAKPAKPQSNYQPRRWGLFLRRP